MLPKNFKYKTNQEHLNPVRLPRNRFIDKVYASTIKFIKIRFYRRINRKLVYAGRNSEFMPLSKHSILKKEKNSP